MEDIRWSDLPPVASRLPHLPLISAKPGRPVVGLVTCRRLRGVYTHFLGNRTQPCMKLNCEGCQKNLPHRWEGYVSLWTATPCKHVLVRLTEAAVNDMHGSAPDWTNIRGLHLSVERASSRANSRLLAKVSVYENNQVRLPEEPDLIAHLVLIWRLSGQTDGFSMEELTTTREEILIKANGTSHA